MAKPSHGKQRSGSLPDSRSAAGGRWVRKKGRKNGKFVWVPDEPLILNAASEAIIRRQLIKVGQYPHIGTGAPANLLRKQGYINALRWVLSEAGLL